MIFKETKFTAQYAEIGQSLDMKFAFVYKDKGILTNQMAWAKCRDFLGDALHAEQEKATKGIYGFYWNPKMQKMYKSKLMFAIKFPNKKSMTNFVTNFNTYSKDIATTCKVSMGKAVVEIGKEKIIVIEAPAFWRKSVAAISLYTFFMKCFGYKLDTTKSFADAVKDTTYTAVAWDNTKTIRSTLESQYMEQTQHRLDTFMRNITKLTRGLCTVHGHEKTAPMNTVHNNSGFHSIIMYNSGVVGRRLAELVA